jgi:hypothetical protein
MEPLNDDELKRLLKKWKAPAAPPSLSRRVLSHDSLGWRRFFKASFRVPVPAAITALCVLALWLLYSKSTEPPPLPEPAATSLAEFRPVSKLEPVSYSGGQR